jgi:hypothetical protein
MNGNVVKQLSASAIIMNGNVVKQLSADAIRLNSVELKAIIAMKNLNAGELRKNDGINVRTGLKMVNAVNYGIETKVQSIK